MNEFEKWLRIQPGVYPTVWEIALARKAWDAAIESTKEQKFGCHVDWKSPKMKKRDWEIYQTCCIDYGRPDDCDIAETVKEKDNCPYWRKIEGERE